MTSLKTKNYAFLFFLQYLCGTIILVIYMFYILNSCNDYILGNILSIIKRTIDLLGIIVPILLIIGGTINVAKVVLNPDDKKASKSIVNCFVSAIIVFLLPIVVNTTMKIISIANDGNTSVGLVEGGKTETFSISACWNSAKIVDINPKFSSAEDSGNTTVSDEQNKNKKDGDTGNNKGSSSSGGSGSSGSSSSGSSSKPTVTPTPSSNTSYKKAVVVGDSRFVWLKDYTAKDSRIDYIAEGNMGFEYLKSQISNIKSRDSENTAFVINLGVNDLYRPGIEKQYISYINNMAKDIKGQIYFMSVNPVIESMAKQNGYNTGWVNNANINKFNQALKNGLDSKKIKYLDSNSYLKINGFNQSDTFDGIHYYGPTYERIKQYILTQLNIK